jgi:diguanylate cyclase (GGDEF)-like protein
MSTPVRLEEETAALRPSGAPMAGEPPVIPGEIEDALRREQAGLASEIVLWQRWVRYLAMIVLVGLSLVFSPSLKSALIPISVIALFYIGVVMATATILIRSPESKPGASFPSLLLATDVVALAGFCYLTSAPTQLYRILLLGFLVLQLGAFYFGRFQGTLASLFTIGAYVLVTAVLPPFVDGPRPAMATIAFNVTLFAMIAAVVVYTFGNFRERIDALRLYCKVVERGESMALPPIAVDRWPDELTLLARCFQSMYAHLAEQVGSDPLTGCLNRRSFEMRLRADLRQARRRGSTVAVAAIDLDHFKEINDTRGHPVGDMILQQVAEILKATARDTDAVARYGGDEFVVVLPDTGWQGALTFADRFRREVDDFGFGPPGGASLSVTVSVGVALGRGTDTNAAETLLQEADAALYRAKTAGRNRVFS